MKAIHYDTETTGLPISGVPSTDPRHPKIVTLSAILDDENGNQLTISNPARDVGRIAGESDGHHTWTVDELRQFWERHPAHTKAGLALALLFYLMPRRSDVVKLGRQMESRDGTSLRWVEVKGRRKKVKVTELPIGPHLRAVLDLHQSNNLHYLTTEYGRPFSAAGFGNWFKDRCREAGLDHCSAHGVRKGSATLAADKGASEFHLMSMGGWSSQKEVARYTRKANRKKLAAEGAKLLTLED